MVEHSRRIDPINLSAKPFCQGEPGAMGLSRMIASSATFALNSAENRLRVLMVDYPLIAESTLTACLRKQDHLCGTRRIRHNGQSDTSAVTLVILNEMANANKNGHRALNKKRETSSCR